MRNKTTAWRVKYETGPCASDCYSIMVYADTYESAKQVVEQHYPGLYITDIVRVKGRKVEQKYMHSMEARALTERARSLEGDYKRAETEKILESIAAAAKKGDDTIQTGILDSVVKRRLENLGYKVKWTEGFDQRDSGFTTISW